MENKPWYASMTKSKEEQKKINDAKYLAGQITFEEWEEIENEIVSPAPKTPVFDGFKKDHVGNLLSGVLKSLNVSWSRLKESKFLQGGTVTMLCAPPGVGKTWFVHNLFLQALEAGIKVSNIQLEDDKDYHLARVIKIACDISITDVDRVYQKELDKLDEQAELIEKIGKSIIIPNSDEKTLQGIATLIGYHASLGSKLIIVDSISVAEKSARPWEDDKRFMNELENILKTYKTRIILVTHPNAPVKGVPTLDLLSGGRSYQRLCQTVLWIEKNEKFVNILEEFEPQFGNRLLVVLKARNAEVMESPLILFDFKNGKFKELGWVK